MKGHYVRSIGEKTIADWLYTNNINYQYEPKLSCFIPDFYLPGHNLIIEYYGLAEIDGIEGKRYRQKIKDKRQYFSSLSVRLLELYSNDLDELDSIFAKVLLKPKRKKGEKS